MWVEILCWGETFLPLLCLGSFETKPELFVTSLAYIDLICRKSSCALRINLEIVLPCITHRERQLQNIHASFFSKIFYILVFLHVVILVILVICATRTTISGISNQCMVTINAKTTPIEFRTAVFLPNTWISWIWTRFYKEREGPTATKFMHKVQKPYLCCSTNNYN